MSKDGPPSEKLENEGEYEVVSFEDFCDKSPGSKTDLLTLNDNINYRLCYESDKGGKLSDNGESSRQEGDHETSLNDNKSVTWRRKATTFAPFGKFDPKPRRASLLGGVIPKPKTEGDGSSRDHRYQRFSNQKTLYERICENLPGLGSTLLILLLIAALSVGVWWAVCGALGGTWGEEHYRRLWERAHPDEARHAPHAPPVLPVAPLEKVLPEYRYHDHNNLSTKNKNNGTEKKKELYKKSFNITAPLPSDCKLVRNNYRFDCHPQEGATEELCVQRGCCWVNKTNDPNEPQCYYPAGYTNYRFLNMTENKRGLSAYYERIRPSGYPDDFETVQMDIKYFDNNIVQVKIFDAVNKRFEPPYPQIPVAGSGISNMTYRVVVDNTGLGLKIMRRNNDTIFNTVASGIILSDKFLQISAVLPFRSIGFGLGEHRDKFKLNMKWNTYTLFNRDAVPVENMNLYGSHAFLLAMEPLADSFGIFLHNSNAMDVVLQPAPAVTYRTTGGILDFYFMLGPHPMDVTTQYYSIIGHPAMPPYWALGFHLSKYNYGSLNETESVWQKNREVGIPLDTQWNDLDYMQNGNDFSYDKKKFAGLPKFVEKLHKLNYHYVVLIDPGISGSEKPGSYPPYDRAIEMDVLIKNSSSQPFVGKVWNRQSTVFPDFTHPNATAYWLEMMAAFHKQVPYDGAWIDMNEPSNFISGSMYGQCEPEDLPYKPKTIGTDGLKTKTLCMDARHYAGPHRDFHNLHAYTESVATHFALAEIRGKRPFIISRASYPGMGQFAGHWSGDVYSDWHDMRSSIAELLNFNLFGIPLMGADICGFRGNVSVELCKRWMQMGAFYPFCRNHNSDTSTPQDPVSLGNEVVEASRKSLRLRYALLPYYYTQFFRAHMYGELLVRPVFFQYTLDLYTHGNDEQFMIGPHLLIAPIVRPSSKNNRIFLPGRTPWVCLFTYKLIPTGHSQLDEENTVLMAPGGILPMQTVPDQGAITTYIVRSLPIILKASVNDNLQANGELFWDDGESLNSYEEKKYSLIKFNIRNNTFTSDVLWWGYGIPHITELFLWNLGEGVKYVNVGGEICVSGFYSHPLLDKRCRFSFDPANKLLHIYNLQHDLQKPLHIVWATYKEPVEKLKARQNSTVYCKDKNCPPLD